MKLLAFIFAGLFLLIWILWGAIRAHYEKYKIDERKHSKRVLGGLETAALLDVLCFGMTIYFLW